MLLIQELFAPGFIGQDPILLLENGIFDVF